MYPVLSCIPYLSIGNKPAVAGKLPGQNTSHSADNLSTWSRPLKITLTGMPLDCEWELMLTWGEYTKHDTGHPSWNPT